MKTYEELAAKALPPVPTLTQAEEVIKRDFPLKLPARTFIRLWNTPETSQFRGVQESLDEEARNREDAEQERIEIRRAAREAGATTVDASLLHDALIQQRQSANALTANIDALNQTHQASLMGMAREQEASLERLAVEQHNAEQCARMADQAVAGLRDTVREESDRIRQMLYSNGVMRPADASASSSGPSPHDERNIHNQAMEMLRSYAQQFGAFMQQQRLGQVQMLELLKGLLRKHQEPLIAPADSGGSPPPPPPGAGAVAMDDDRAAGSSREGMMMTGPPPPQPPMFTPGVSSGPPPPPPPAAGAIAAMPPPPAPKPRPPPIVTNMVPKAIPKANPNVQVFDISTPREPRPPPAGLNADPPEPVPQVFSEPTTSTEVPTFAPAPKKRAAAVDGQPRKRGRPTLEEQMQRVRNDYSISADERMDRILGLQARIDRRDGKNKREPPPTASSTKRKTEETVTALAPIEEETTLVLQEKAPKKPRVKAAAVVKDSAVVESKPKKRTSKKEPLLAIEGPEQPETLPPPARTGPPKGKKLTIRVVPLTSSVNKARVLKPTPTRVRPSSVNKEGILKPTPKRRGRPRKTLVAPVVVEPEFA
jgi:hypothetical protein